MQAILALEDGTWFEGVAAGAQGETSGEVVFNTSMTGYQEVLTDPSYAGQIVTMTCPEIGNYGVSSEDVESRKPQVAGFIIRDESPVASNWRAAGTLRDYLAANDIVAISDIDTRALTRLLRSAGVMRGVVATGNTLDIDTLVEHARAIPKMEGSDLVKVVKSGVPTFGICLGHQILGLAMGGSTYKLKFGHRGANHPVKKLSTGKIEITSQNHGFAVDPDTLPADVEVTHKNLYDGTVEGLRHKNRPVFCVQYHTEASPGPHDADYLFNDYIQMIEEVRG